MNNKNIRIHARGTRKTDKQKVKQLSDFTPNALSLARKILVTAEKYRKGGGLFSSKKKRMKLLQTQINDLEKALEKDGFRERQKQIEGPESILIDYFSLISNAYPNWQIEYKLLENIIPKCY